MAEHITNLSQPLPLNLELACIESVWIVFWRFLLALSAVSTGGIAWCRCIPRCLTRARLITAREPVSTSHLCLIS